MRRIVLTLIYLSGFGLTAAAQPSLGLETAYFEVSPLGFNPTSPWIPRAAVLDINGDGHLDIVYAYRGGLVVLQNDGTGRFVLRSDGVQLQEGQIIDWPRDLAVADFDGNGRMDLFLADHGDEPKDRPFPGGQSQIFITQPDGYLREETSTRFPQETSFTHGTTVGDITGNGAPDIYLASYLQDVGTNPGPRFYINDGTGNFTSEPHRLPAEVREMQAQSYPSAVFIDVNRNGHLDLVLGGSPHGERDRLLVNDGTGHFTFAPEDALPPRYAKSRMPGSDWRRSEWASWHIETADFDGDGWPDLIVSMLFDFTSTHLPNTNPHEETRIQLLLNNRNGTFRDATHLIPQAWPRVHSDLDEGWIVFTHPVDLNGNGFPDLVSNGLNVPSKIFYNVNGEYFVDASELIPELEGNFSMVVPGDFTGNGLADLAILNNSWGRRDPYLAFNTKPFFFDETMRPAVTSIAPSSGEAGTVVTVAGTGLARTVRAWVGETETSFEIVSDMEVALDVPVGATTGPVTLITRFGTVAAETFVVTNAPEITGFSLESGGVGSQIIIFGRYFADVTGVWFNDVDASFAIRSDTEIVSEVPAGASTGDVRVVSPNGEATAHFVVLAPPPQTHALVFDQDIARAPSPQSAPLLNLGAEFTMETWFLVEEDQPWGMMMGKRHPVSEDPWSSYSLGFHDNRLQVAASTGAFGSNRVVYAPFPPSHGVWTHAAATLKDDVLRLFLNGSEVGSTGVDGPPDNAEVPFTVGSGLHRDGWLMDSFLGALREVRVWDRALTATELRGGAGGTLAGDEAGLVAYWPLDEGSGRTAFDMGPNAYHLSFGVSENDHQYAPKWHGLSTSTEVGEQGAQSQIGLEPNYPNPFRFHTTLVFTLPHAAEVKIAVYDIMGRQVGTVADERLQAGVHERTFDAGTLPSGAYLVRITSGDFSQTRRVMLVR